jgi:hypothetical protein
MAHFAEIDTNNTVLRVIVAEPNFILTLPGRWIQTSYNTYGGIHYDPETKSPSLDQSKALRYNYAGAGYTYDSERDAFIPPKPNKIAVLNELTCLWEYLENE